MGIRGNKNGVSIIAAVFIIVILAFMGVIFVTLIGTGSFTSVNEMQSAQALYVAEGGLESAVISLNTSTLGNRIACANVTGDANLTDEPLGQGQFRVTSDAGAPFYPANAATLAAGGINSTDTTINTNAAPAGYASSGRIMIDRELIDYSGISGSSFVGAVRGRDGTTAVSHAQNTRVGQYQCSVTSAGGIPTVAAPTAKRTVKEGIQLQEGWAVGDNGVILRWNGTAWAAAASPVGSDLTSISMLSYADARAVGDRTAATNNGWVFLTWNGTNWTRTNTTNPGSGGAGLTSVFMVSATDGWAVGGPNADRFLHWSAGSWINTAGAAQQLNSVYLLDTDNDGIADDGWAVGVRTAAGNNGWLFYRWDGAAWVRTNRTTPDSNARSLNSVFMTSAADGWAVGGANGDIIVHWTGGAWTNFGAAPAALNSVYMLDTDGNGIAEDGWAVGNASGGELILRWNGAAWVRSGPSALIPNDDLYGVSCVTSSDCWAVGENGTILHWDGTSWVDFASPTGQLLRSVSIIGPRQRPQAAWQEVIQ